MSKGEGHSPNRKGTEMKVYVVNLYSDDGWSQEVDTIGVYSSYERAESAAFDKLECTETKLGYAEYCADCADSDEVPDKYADWVLGSCEDLYSILTFEVVD